MTKSETIIVFYLKTNHSKLKKKSYNKIVFYQVMIRLNVFKKYWIKTFREVKYLFEKYFCHFNLVLLRGLYWNLQFCTLISKKLVSTFKSKKVNSVTDLEFETICKTFYHSYVFFSE